MDDYIGHLTGYSPSDWKEVIRRFEIVASFRSLSNPTRNDVEDHARRLGLHVRSFYRLVAVYDRYLQNLQGSSGRPERRRRLSSEVLQMIADVRRDLGREVPDRSVFVELRRRCEAVGIRPPSFKALRMITERSNLDLRIRLGRRFDLIVDACSLDFDVEDDGGVKIAWLCALLDGATGMVLEHRLTAGGPTADDLVEIMRSPSVEDRAPALVLATGDLPGMLDGVRHSASTAGITIDLARSRGLRHGGALVPSLGARIGKVTLSPRRSTAAASKRAVPIRLARSVLARLIDRRHEGVGLGLGVASP